MRHYDDPVEVRRGMVPGPGGRLEGPEQFLWRGRLWKVRDVLAHWVETGAWWASGNAQAVLGADVPSGALQAALDPVAEREVWRVEAGRGPVAPSGAGAGVFDLTYDGTDGSWQLTRCAD